MRKEIEEALKMFKAGQLVGGRLLKPGTKEHNAWIKGVVITDQLNDPTIYGPAKAIADERLAQLKNTYAKAVLLDPDIEALVNGTTNVPDLQPVDPHRDLLEEVNHVWDRTKLGPVDEFCLYVPQISNYPNFVKESQLYDILREASLKDLSEIKQQNGRIFYAVLDPNWMLRVLNVPMNAIPTAQRYGQVLVEYIRYRR
jgi:hypothetical protein